MLDIVDARCNHEVRPDMCVPVELSTFSLVIYIIQSKGK